MKVLILTILVIVISAVVVCNGESPSLVRGISYDGHGNILFAVNENEKTSFVAVSSNGQIITKKFDVVNPQNSKLDYFYDYIPSHDRYYVRFIQQGSPIFSIYNQHTNQMEYVNNIFNTPFVPVFDKNRNLFVFGGYGIFGLDRLPTNKQDAQSAREIYESQMVNGLTMEGTDLYMTTYQGEILKGTLTCVNCTNDKLTRLASEPDASRVSAPLVVLGDYIFYAHSNGITAFPKDGDVSKVRELVHGENVNSMTTDGTLIFYATEYGAIKSLSATGVVKVLFSLAY